MSAKSSRDGTGSQPTSTPEPDLGSFTIQRLPAATARSIVTLGKLLFPYSTEISLQNPSTVACKFDKADVKFRSKRQLRAFERLSKMSNEAVFCKHPAPPPRGKSMPNIPTESEMSGAFVLHSPSTEGSEDDPCVSVFTGVMCNPHQQGGSISDPYQKGGSISIRAIMGSETATWTPLYPVSTVRIPGTDYPFYVWRSNDGLKALVSAGFTVTDQNGHTFEPQEFVEDEDPQQSSWQDEINEV